MASDLYLYVLTVRDLLRPRRAAGGLLLALIPAAVGLLWRMAARGSYEPEAAYNAISGGLVFGFVLVLLAAVFGTGAVSGEVEQGTIAYLLTRPVPRARILTAKFLASLSVLVPALWLSAAALALAAHGPPGLRNAVFRYDLAFLPLGGAAYGAAFLLLGALLQRPLLWGLLYAFGWETWVPSMPGAFKKASLMSYLRTLVPHPAPEAEVVDISEVFAMLNPTTIPQALAWRVLLAVTVVGFLGALIAFSRREYAPRDDAA